MRLETHVVSASDGVELFVRKYLPEQIDCTRTLYWVHGLGEHGGRQEHIAEVLTRRGWQMIIPDLRGHGRSGGLRTYVRSFEAYIDDIRTVWNDLRLNSTPPVMLGHSMGGLVAVRAVQSGQMMPRALVLSSPLLGLKLNLNPVKHCAANLLGRIIPTIRLSNGIDPANMTRDSQFAAIRKGDPLINKTITLGWFVAMQAALAAAQRDADKVVLPVMAVQGDCDRTTDPTALDDWWDRIRSQDKTKIVLKDHIHELFFEPDWSQTTSLVVDWLEDHLRSSSRLPVDGSSE